MFVEKFPAGLLRAIHSKLRLPELMTLQTVHPKFKDHYFDWSLDESMGTISLQQFVNFFQSYETVEERSVCFHPKVINRLRFDFQNVVSVSDVCPMEVISGTILPLLEGEVVIDGRRIVGDQNTRGVYWVNIFALLERIEEDIYFVVRNMARIFALGINPLERRIMNSK